MEIAEVEVAYRGQPEGPAIDGDAAGHRVDARSVERLRAAADLDQIEGAAAVVERSREDPVSVAGPHGQRFAAGRGLVELDCPIAVESLDRLARPAQLPGGVDGDVGRVGNGISARGLQDAFGNGGGAGVSVRPGEDQRACVSLFDPETGIVVNVGDRAADGQIGGSCAVGHVEQERGGRTSDQAHWRA